MHDRKDPLDWDLNGSSQSSGGDFPRLNFSRQHSQGAPQQQAPPPPPPQFNRQLSNDIFGHVPNGNTWAFYSRLSFTGFRTRNRFLIKKSVFDQETGFCSINRFSENKPVFVVCHKIEPFSRTRKWTSLWKEKNSKERRRARFWSVAVCAWTDSNRRIITWIGWSLHVQ